MNYIIRPISNKILSRLPGELHHPKTQLILNPKAVICCWSQFLSQVHEKIHVELLLFLLLIRNQLIYFTLKNICYSPIKNKINKNHDLEESQRHFPRPHLKPSQKHLWPQHLPIHMWRLRHC